MIEDDKDKPNLYMLCRICAMQCADLKNIFEKSNQAIFDMLIENTDIEFSEADILPKQICEMCISELIACHEFRLKSKKSDTILKDLFLNLKKKNKDESLSYKEKVETKTHKENVPKLKTQEENPKTLKKNQTYKNNSSGNSCHYRPKQKKIILQRQKLIQKGIPPYKCQKCGKSYVKFANLREHQNAHNGIKPFSCKICKRAFVTNRQLIVHTRIHTKLNPYLCSTCGEKFTHLSTFIAHNRIHTGEKPYGCLQCKKAFHTASARMLHIKRKKCADIDKDNVKQNTLCYICGQVYSSQIALQNHIVKHTGQTTFNCHMCDKGFAREDHLKSHIRTHTGERPFVCPFCNKSFSQSGILQTHLALHNGKKFPCEICGKSFPRPAHLKRHKLIHTGEKKFRCKFCDKQFTQKAHLRTHENTHLADHPFKCSTCNLSFSQNVTLQKHILTHTGERPFLCHLCGISYTQTGRLASHMKKVHGTEKSCEIENRPDELNSTLQSIFNQEEENVVLENISNPQTSNGPVLGNQTFELVTQSGQRFLATSLVLLPNQFNVVSENDFIP